MRYSEKRRDPRWQRKRLEIMGRDDFTCQQCGSTTSTLNVHHRYYEPGRDPWDYPNGALITLCEDCHGGEHGLLKRNRVTPMPLTETLLRVLIACPGLALSLSAEQRANIEGPEFAAVNELIDLAAMHNVGSVAEVLEATRGSRYSSQYEEAVRVSLEQSIDEETLRTLLLEVLLRLERRQVEREFKRLTASPQMNESDRLSLNQLSQRLMQLKGQPTSAAI